MKQTTGFKKIGLCATQTLNNRLAHLRDFFQPKSLILRYQRIFMKKIPLKSMVFF